MGRRYFDGVGISQDYNKAASWIQKAAEQKYAKAQNSLGSLYFNGQGVEQDYAEAENWYRKAAEQELVEAQCNLASLYYGEAKRWYKKAAKQGNAEAQKMLEIFDYKEYIFKESVTTENKNTSSYYQTPNYSYDNIGGLLEEYSEEDDTISNTWTNTDNAEEIESAETSKPIKSHMGTIAFLEDTAGEIAIQNAMKRIWGQYDSFMVDSFPYHCFYKREMFINGKKPVYIIGINCSAFKQPFEIYIEAMSFGTSADKTRIYLSAYSPKLVTAEGNRKYDILEYVLDRAKRDPYLAHESKLELQKNVFTRETGLTLYTEYNYSDYGNSGYALESTLRKFYEEAKEIYGYAADYLYQEGIDY